MAVVDRPTRPGLSPNHPLGPTCSTMSRARQRNHLTKVRDAEHPWGIPGLEGVVLEEVQAANRLAIATDELAGKAHTLLNADISVENPADAFIWQLGLFKWPGVQDTVFSPCMLGDDIFKPTRIKSHRHLPTIDDSSMRVV